MLLLLGVLRREGPELVVHGPVEVVPKKEGPKPVEGVHLGHVVAASLALLPTATGPLRVHLRQRD